MSLRLQNYQLLDWGKIGFEGKQDGKLASSPAGGKLTALLTCCDFQLSLCRFMEGEMTALTKNAEGPSWYSRRWISSSLAEAVRGTYHSGFCERPPQFGSMVFAS